MSVFADTSFFIAVTDKEWRLTDCTSFVLMKKLRISKALTVDPHFEQAGFDPVLLKTPPK